LLASKLSTFRV